MCTYLCVIFPSHIIVYLTRHEILGLNVLFNLKMFFVCLFLRNLMLFLLLIIIYIPFFLFFLPSILEDVGSSLPHDSLMFHIIWFFKFINVVLFIYYVRYSIIPFRMRSQSSSSAKVLLKGRFCVLFCFVLLLIFSLFFILLLHPLISLAEVMN